MFPSLSTSKPQDETALGSDPIPFESLGRMSSLLPALTLWRPYRREDLVNVKLLLKPEAYELFGPFDLEEMTEFSDHTVVVENEYDQIIGCVSLRNYANVPAILPEVWVDVFRTLYGVTELNFENTLFIHMLLWNPCYNWDFLMNIFKSLFLTMFRLEYVVLLVPPLCMARHSERMLAKYIVKILPKQQEEEDEVTSCQRLYVTFRSQVLPSLRVRLALAEDNDDVVHILDESAPELRQKYGDYYIAEIISNKASSRTIIVAELNNEVVGMMSLNTDASMAYLYHNVDAAAYNDFCKITERSQAEFSDSILSLKSKYFKHSISYIHDHEDVPWIMSTENSSDIEDEMHGSSTDEFLIQLKDVLDMSQTLSFQRTALTSDSSNSNSKWSPPASTTPSVLNKSNTSLDIKEHRKMVRDLFFIELHGMRGDMDERLAQVLVEAAFDLYPDLSYCLMSFPPSTRYFPMLSCFVNVAENSLSSNELRACVVAVQRNALFSPIQVRLIEPSDEEEILNFLQTIWKGDYHANYVMSTLNSCLGTKRHTAYSLVIKCIDTIIGVCVVKKYYYLDDMALYFNLSEYIVVKQHNQADRSGMMKMMILHPAFMTRLPFVQAEIFRITGFTNLLFKIKGAKTEPLLNTMLWAMIPIRPRLRVPNERFTIESHHHEGKKSYALYHQNVAMCAKRKIRVNERLVVVGCSTTANSFLEELIYGKDSHKLWFTSITLISPNGFTTFFYDDHARASRNCFFKRRYNNQYNRQLGLATWINVVCGSVEKIDRQMKAVTVSDGRRFFYDYLFLFCGLQFDYPLHLKVPEKQPNNLEFINNSMEADQFIRRAEHLQRTVKPCNIILYGETSQCYTYIDICLRLKVKPKYITFIRHKIGPLFNDPFVNKFMNTLLLTSGIKVIDNYHIVDWKIDDKNSICKIIVESELDRLELPCSMFVCLERKIVQRRTIRVLNEARLVFDGRLVINEQCQTSDPNIYAAGPMTKYRRILYADNYRHEYFSSTEVGARLATYIFDQINPLRPSGEFAHSSRLPRTVHVYNDCMIHYRPVLDGYFFLSIRMPGRLVPYSLMKAVDNCGAELITRNRKHAMEWGSQNVRYFRINLNSNNCVSTITCLTREALNIRKFMAIWGHHVTILGDLQIRYEMNLIDDFFEYFTQSWTYVLANDHYQTAAEDDLIEDIITNIVLNKWKNLSKVQREKIIERFITSPLLQRLESNLMDFLREHVNEFPMYYLPTKIEQ